MLFIVSFPIGSTGTTVKFSYVSSGSTRSAGTFSSVSLFFVAFSRRSTGEAGTVSSVTFLVRFYAAFFFYFFSFEVNSELESFFSLFMVDPEFESFFFFFSSIYPVSVSFEVNPELESSFFF